MSYLNYIQEKEMVTNSSKQSCTTMRDALNKDPVGTTKNIINFLNTLSEEDLRKMGIKEKVTVITWARKVVGKHQYKKLCKTRLI